MYKSSNCLSSSGPGLMERGQRRGKYSLHNQLINPISMLFTPQVGCTGSMRDGGFIAGPRHLISAGSNLEQEVF